MLSGNWALFCPADAAAWAAARRVAAGRVVNGYGRDDYVLAVLARVSGANWRVAGLSPVDVPGVDLGGERL